MACALLKSSILSILCPCNITLLFGIKFDKTFARVDFPAPFLPRIIRFSPSFKENVISFKISLL